MFKGHPKIPVPLHTIPVAGDGVQCRLPVRHNIECSPNLLLHTHHIEASALLGAEASGGAQT